MRLGVNESMRRRFGTLRDKEADEDTLKEYNGFPYGIYKADKGLGEECARVVMIDLDNNGLFRFTVSNFNKEFEVVHEKDGVTDTMVTEEEVEP